METAFSVESDPRLYNEDSLPELRVSGDGSRRRLRRVGKKGIRI
jgi:hypothetical protein